MEQKDIIYRHEWKHEISHTDMLILRQRLKTVAKPDAHLSGEHYHVRSLYFDNLFDKALREKIDGVDRREKFRIRYYNFDSTYINLEKKCKVNGIGFKVQTPVTKRQVEALIKGDVSWLEESSDPLMNELIFKMKTQGIKPKTIVDYEREPYVYPAGNVRVTLDYHIRTGLSSKAFFDPQCPMVPVQNDPIILEVKWDDFLPNVIRDMVQLKGRRVTAFSKYAMCRMYD